MRTIELDCRICKAKPGEYCDVVDANGVRFKAAFAYHAERIEDAAACTENKQPMSVDAFRAALDNSGRF